MHKFEFGDRVRHARRPEWGIGSIVKAEETTVNGERAQRLSVRFPNAGLKTVSTAHADLQLVNDDAAAGKAETDGHRLGGWDKMSKGDWLGEVAQRKVAETMVALAPEVRDPFNSLQQRLESCLDLYRFDRSGRSLIDWAVAQSGLDDPLTRFTRHELELMFDQWVSGRDRQLQRLLEEARSEQAMVSELVASAPPPARESVRKLTANR